MPMSRKVCRSVAPRLVTGGAHFSIVLLFILSHVYLCSSLLNTPLLAILLFCSLLKLFLSSVLLSANIFPTLKFSSYFSSYSCMVCPLPPSGVHFETERNNSPLLHLGTLRVLLPGVPFCVFSLQRPSIVCGIDLGASVSLVLKTPPPVCLRLQRVCLCNEVLCHSCFFLF